MRAEEIRKKLLSWYDENKRPLPWRETKDPYFIWISEIIFQQTRISQGIDYYQRFVGRFPDIYSLAEADEREVLALWQGLGYYSRARNLHYTAKEIVHQQNGRFPRTYDDLLKLKGIGDYTASCIASICFNKPFAAVDGNVFRVLARYYQESIPINTTNGKKVFKSLTQDWLDPERPGDYNEAMMDLGATVCMPRNPGCDECPLGEGCQSAAMGTMEEFPVKEKKGKVRERYFNYFLISQDSTLCLQQRQEKDIWLRLYELPLIEGKLSIPELSRRIAEKTGTDEVHVKKAGSKKHILSHQILHISFYELDTGTAKWKDSFLPCETVGFSDLHRYPLPRPIELFLNERMNPDYIT